MSGHSKWATTKHKKMAIDAKRGKIFTKLIKEITVAARLGGGDQEGNARLRTVILKAKEANMPADNIKKAVQRGTGELPGVSYDEILYEGYGPGGVALLMNVMTDNRNRTVSDIRHILTKYGGNMGESGSVSWMFEKKGYIVIEGGAVEEDRLMALVLDAGAEDLRRDGVSYEVLTVPAEMDRVKKALEAEKIPTLVAEVTMLPQVYIALEGKNAEHMVKLMDALEDNDDVQNVYANFNVPDEVLDRG